jgi:sarcosine oxidase subunit gamma
VIAEAVRRSALVGYKDRFDALTAATGGDLSIRELPFVTQLNLRADPNDAALMQRLESALGFALPVVPNTVSSHRDWRALWLGPDEWLVVSPDGQEDALEAALRNGLNGTFGSIVDVSANRTLLEVRGPNGRELLAHGIPIDLDARSFGPGRCSQTLLANAQVIIERRSDDPAFHLYIRSTFASYAADWFLDAASE